MDVDAEVIEIDSDNASDIEHDTGLTLTSHPLGHFNQFTIEDEQMGCSTCVDELVRWYARGIPLILLRIIAKLRPTVQGMQQFDGLEVFAGVMHIVRGLVIEGLCAVGFEKSLNADSTIS